MFKNLYVEMLDGRRSPTTWNTEHGPRLTAWILNASLSSANYLHSPIWQFIVESYNVALRALPVAT